MLWRRYRSTMLWSVPIGIVVGCVFSLTVYFTGNPDYRDQGGWGAFSYSLVTGGIAGGLTAIAAVIGGLLGVLSVDRRMNRPRRTRIRVGSLGAAAGAAALWLAVGVWDTVASSSGAGWLSWIAIAAGVVAAISGVAASLLLRLAEASYLSTS